MVTSDTVGWIIAAVIILALYLASIFVENKGVESSLIMMALFVSFFAGSLLMNTRTVSVVDYAKSQ